VTFLEIINSAKQKYKNKNNVVDFELLFFCSKIVKDKTQFIINRNKKIDFNQRKYFSYLKRYYVLKEPLGSIIGNVDFLGLKIKVYKNILVPREETEIVTKKAIALIKKTKVNEVYDLCCGTGNIGLAIKKACDVNVTCIDINPVAIRNTKFNAKSNSLKVNTICGDFIKSIKHKIPCIVCNPPYVDKNDLDVDMTKYESSISFTNSKSDTFFYEEIIKNINKLMTPKYLIIFEIGFNQKTKLIQILKRHNVMKYSSFYKDASENDRILVISNHE
jgi:release factor glutamine methyltransferase